RAAQANRLHPARDAVLPSRQMGDGLPNQVVVAIGCERERVAPAADVIGIVDDGPAAREFPTGRLALVATRRAGFESGVDEEISVQYADVVEENAAGFQQHAQEEVHGDGRGRWDDASLAVEILR